MSDYWSKYWKMIGLGVTAILIPGGGIIVGSILIWRALKKKKAQKRTPEPYITGEFRE